MSADDMHPYPDSDIPSQRFDRDQGMMRSENSRRRAEITGTARMLGRDPFFYFFIFL
jgi:hypothetical protein